MAQTPPPSYDAALSEKYVENTNVANQSPVSYQNPTDSAYNSGYPNVENQAPSGFSNIIYKPAESANAPRVAAAAPVVEDDEAGGFTVRGSFADLDVRRLYIRKVFMTLGLQLLFTFGVVCLFFFQKSVQQFVQTNAGMYYAAYAVFLVLYFVLVCSVNAVRAHPWNLVMLACLTAALSYMVGAIASFHTLYAVVVGMGVTVGVCTTVILFSMQTKFDFTKCAGLLFVLSMVLVLFCFVTIFTWYYSWYVQVVYGCLGALVFTLFLAFDTQLIMGGRKYELNPEEYVYGALILYIDIIYIFLFLLSIFGGSSN